MYPLLAQQAATPPSLDAGSATVLGIIQGLTEFLPISSDGHLALASRLLRAGDNLETTVLLHAGTLLATLLVFRNDVLALLQEFLACLRDPSRLRRDPRGQELLAIVLTSIPTAIIGLGLHDAVDRWSRIPWIVGLCFLGTGLVLIVSRFAKPVPLFTWTPTRAILIGIAQGLAVLPGLSRSACTISSALLLGAPPVDAFRYSFVASLPAVGGALLLELRKPGALSRAGGASGMLGATVAFFVGLAALYALRALVARGRLWQFAIYVVPLAIFTLILGMRA